MTGTASTSLGLPERPARAKSPMPADKLDVNSLAVLLDFDGTLVELKPTPQEVRVPPSLKHTLSRLRDRLDGALCLVSGRPLADLDVFLDPLRLAIVGGHGAENRLTPNGLISRAKVEPLDPELRRRLLAIATGTEGILVENKEYSVALHYRLVPELERAIFDDIVRICSAWPVDTIEVLPGKSVFEVKPSAFNKGVAVRELMQHEPFAGRRPVFIGDDVTDETVFAVLPDYDGLGFSVGRELKGTQGMFATPREVRHWLYELMRNGG
jgi:trehalose 6-phosphate phosphatase